VLEEGQEEEPSERTVMLLLGEKSGGLEVVVQMDPNDTTHSLH